MYCWSCGKEIDDNSKFCPECGASTVQEKPGTRKTGQAKKKKRTQKKKKTWLFVVIALLLVGGAVAGYLFYSNNQKEQKAKEAALSAEAAERDRAVEQAAKNFQKQQSQKEEYPFEDYDVISFTFASEYEAPFSSDFPYYKVECKVRNNSNTTLSDIAATACFYNSAGDVVYSESRVIGYSLQAGQSAYNTFYSDQPFSTAKITNYEYIPKGGMKLPSGSNGVRIDTVTGEVTFIHMY